MVLFLITVALITAYSFYQNKRALTQFSHDYVDKYTESLVKTVETAMFEPSEASHLVTLWLQKIKNINEIKPEQIMYLKNLFKIFNYISTLHLAFESGELLHFHAIHEGECMQTKSKELLPLNIEYYIITIKNQDGKNIETWGYYNKNDKLILEETIPVSTYDPRSREWYIQAKASKNVNTSSVIKVSFFIKNLVISTSRPFLDENNDVWGVAAADIDVRRISQLLKDNILSPGSVMFILDDNEEVIAASNLEMPALAHKGSDAAGLSLKEIGNSIYANAFQKYKNEK